MLLWSRNYFMFAALNLEITLLLWLKHFDIDLCKFLCRLEIYVFIFIHKLCVLLEIQSDSAHKATDWYFIGLYPWTWEKGYYLSSSHELVVFCEIRTFAIYQCSELSAEDYYNGLNITIFMSGYQETAAVKIELGLHTSAAKDLINNYCSRLKTSVKYCK